MVLFASDYDGTLRRNGEISQGDLRQISEFRKAGNLFGIVTGRVIDMIAGELDYFQVEWDFIIGGNGCIAVNKQRDVLFLKPILQEAAVKLFEELERDKATLSGISDGIYFGRINDGDFQRDMTGVKNHNTIIQATPVDSRSIVEKGRISSFFIRRKEVSQTKAYLAELKTAYAGQMDFHYNNGTIDVTAAGVSKTTGVKFIKDYFGVDVVYVAGDGHNDIDMIRNFKGFSLTNAEEDVKKQASKIFDSLGECLAYSKI